MSVVFNTGGDKCARGTYPGGMSDTRIQNTEASVDSTDIPMDSTGGSVAQWLACWTQA